MFKKIFVEYIRDLLTKILERSNRDDTRTPRQKKSWFHMEYHFPPAVVAVTSAILLYFAFCVGIELTGIELVSYGIFVIVLVVLFSFYMIQDHPKLARNDEAMALLAVIFFTTLLFIKLVALFSGKVPYLSPNLAPVSFASLLAALL